MVCSTYMSPCWGCLSTEPRSFAYRGSLTHRCPMCLWGPGSFLFCLEMQFSHSGFKFDPSKCFQHLVIPLNLHGLSLNCIEITVSAEVLALFHVNVPGFALLRSINSPPMLIFTALLFVVCGRLFHLPSYGKVVVGRPRLQSHLWNKHPNLQLMFWS